MITCKDVTKYFGSYRALENLNFTVQDGEFVFLTGPSGSGKTTLIRLLNGELRTDKGEITLGKLRLDQLKKKQVPHLRRQLGIVFQDSKLLSDMTVFENVALSLRIRHVPVKQIYQQVNQILESIGLQHRKMAFPSQLAGGELQRACLARAVITDPPVILADEPTGNLDPATSWQIMSLLKEINKQGTTIVMATHDVEIVNSFNYRIINLEKGQIVSDQTGKYA